MTRRIVVAPAGSRFFADAGSEDGWIYDIVTGVAASEPNCRFTCVTEQADGPLPDGVHAVSIGRRRTEELGGLLLPIRMARAAAAVSRLDEVDLVHHALPFAVGRSYSLLAAWAHRRGVPVIIGPVQTPLEWTEPDEDGGQLAAEGQQPLRRATTATAGAVWPVAEAAFAHFSGRTLRRAEGVVVIGQPALLLVESGGVDPRRVEIIPPPTWVLSRAPAHRARRSGPPHGRRLVHPCSMAPSGRGLQPADWVGFRREPATRPFQAPSQRNVGVCSRKEKRVLHRLGKFMRKDMNTMDRRYQAMSYLQSESTYDDSVSTSTNVARPSQQDVYISGAVARLPSQLIPYS